MAIGNIVFLIPAFSKPKPSAKTEVKMEAAEPDADRPEAKTGPASRRVPLGVAPVGVPNQPR
jgi:hypothetical protein